MGKFTKNLVQFVFLLVIASAISSCSKAFLIRVEGRLDEAVTFSFYYSSDTLTPTELTIAEFVVQQKGDQSSWSTIWELTGERKLSQIGYGQSYENLKIVVQPKALSRNGTYRALAKEKSYIGPMGYSSVTFSVDDTGVIVVE